MKALVTGADGLLGSHLVRELLSREYEVRVFLLTGTKSTTLDDLEIERQYGNLLNPDEVDKAVEGCEIVVHAAANTNVWPPRSEIIRRVNFEGTENIVKACQKHQVKRLIYISSGACFDTGPKDNPGDETSPFRGDRFGLDYIDSKYKAHVFVETAAKNGELPAVLICPNFMFGPYDSKPSGGQMILAVYTGKAPGYTPGGKNFVHARDVATAAINAIEMGRIGESYIAGHANMDYKELFTIIGETLNVKTPSLKVPRWVFLTLGFFGTLFGKITGKDPGVTLPVARIGITDQYHSPAKAIKELKMPQTPIKEAIQEGFDWMEANGMVKKK